MRGNIQLTPIEVQKLHTILISTSSHPNRTVALDGLKCYTIILLGIKQFLRSDELLDIEVDDFISNLQIIRPEKGVEALVMKICGNTNPVSLYLLFGLTMDIQNSAQFTTCSFM
jgi:integrase